MRLSSLLTVAALAAALTQPAVARPHRAKHHARTVAAAPAKLTPHRMGAIFTPSLGSVAISALPNAGVTMGGGEMLPLVQSGVTTKTTLNVLSAFFNLHLPFGTVAGTVAQGNDPRIVGALQASAAAKVATTGAYGDLSGVPPLGLGFSGGALPNPFNLSVNGLPRFALATTTPTTGDPWTSPDAVMFGGQSDMDSAHAYIRGMPYGPLDLGTNLSVVQTDRPLQGTRAGIGPNGIGAAANYFDYDSVNVYNQAGTTPARIIASSAFTDPNDSLTHAVSYGPNVATFNPPLPAADAALLRQQMYVKTNSVGTTNNQRTSLGQPDPTGRYPTNTYGGQLQSWTLNAQGQVTSITVDGWVVIGSGNAATNQVPSTTYDTVVTNYAAPTVFFGTPTKSFNENKVCNLLALNQPGTAPGQPGYGNNPLGTLGAQQTQCEGAEWDLSSAITTPYLATLHGLTIQSGAANGVPLSNDSYNLHLGGPMPHQIVIDELSTNDWLRTNSAVFYGNVGPATGDGLGTKRTFWEMAKYPNGAGLDRFGLYLQRDVPFGTGSGQSESAYGTHSIRLGEIQGGSLGDSGAQGTFQTQLVWGGPNLSGGFAICPFGYVGSDATQCPFFVNTSGLVKQHRPWLDLRTPASSSDACVAGEFTDDANYHYVCVATNTWKRSQLAAYPAITVASLPACTSANEGFIQPVSDAASPAYNESLTGGGSTHVPAYCNGTSWTAH